MRLKNRLKIQAFLAKKTENKSKSRRGIILTSSELLPFKLGIKVESGPFIDNADCLVIQENRFVRYSLIRAEDCQRYNEDDIAYLIYKKITGR